MSGLNNREWRELEKLQTKSHYSKLSERDERRMEKLKTILEGVQQPHVPKNPKSKYHLSEFKPVGKQIQYSSDIDAYDTVVVQAPSGCGKSTVAVWKGLSMLGKQYDKIMFIKTPNESGDDKLGFLDGGKDNKLIAHLKNMRGVFLEFMSLGQLESDEKNGNIVFEIPNYIQGGTFKRTFVIIDEMQNMSPKTVKLLLERFTDDCKVICLGDYDQVYSADYREDGFTDLVDKITDVETIEGKELRYCVEPNWSYIELPPTVNMRGERSRRVTEMYAGTIGKKRK